MQLSESAHVTPTSCLRSCSYNGGIPIALSLRFHCAAGSGRELPARKPDARRAGDVSRRSWLCRDRLQPPLGRYWPATKPPLRGGRGRYRSATEPPPIRYRSRARPEPAPRTRQDPFCQQSAGQIAPRSHLPMGRQMRENAKNHRNSATKPLPHCTGTSAYRPTPLSSFRKSRGPRKLADGWLFRLSPCLICAPLEPALSPA
jgi:hypothetical protein